MALKLITSVAALGSSFTLAKAQRFVHEDLILCDCGIGDNKDHPTWSTSRQMNWYQDITWPDSRSVAPNAPDMSVQVPFHEGIYPWIPSGATAAMPNGDVWTVYIEDGTPNGYIAGNAVSTKEGGQSFNCWAYRDHPVGVALNKTVNPNAQCRSAFVCNRDDRAPPVPKEDTETSSVTSTAAPTTTFFSEGQPKPTDTEPAPPPAPTTTGTQPAPSPDLRGALFVNAYANPRFITWPAAWSNFIASFVWDQKTGRCTAQPIRQQGYTINIDCGGIQIDDDSHLTLLLIQALREIGLKSLWFNQSPIIPSNNGTNITTSEKWVVMPEAFSLRVTDQATKDVIGYIGYSTKYDGFLTGPCSTCETVRFNKDFFDPIIEAMQGTYPVYNRYTVQGQCEPWRVCK